MVEHCMLWISPAVLVPEVVMETVMTTEGVGLGIDPTLHVRNIINCSVNCIGNSIICYTDCCG